MDNIDFHIFYSHPEAESELATDRLQQGHVDVSSIQKITGGLDVQYYICGPPPMMGALIPALEASGVATSSILTEAFGPSTRKTAVATEQNVEDKKSPELQIHFGHSDKTFGWTGQTSILEIAEDAGIMIDSSCRSGTCGTCEVRLNHGKVTYEEEPSAEIRDGHCLACVAIPIDDIEIQA
jgi:ferredoxin